uniref:Integrase, catalytic region, zinc finger, CCHC-type, peptidase aspartic, catalytic n=1 Tax=Tanacetum cinerariifolium TaxID=118510 RepID=A0A6L2P3T2_TANCI|nr:integrase, catalytic region, zinc finger, CCHC-type, peptidase aspartic, catalytic [Tanacetum cinerariifolium]
MRTRRSYFPPTSTIPRRSRKQTTNVVEPEIHTIVEMADNRTLAQMLQAPIEGYEDAIVVTQINANNSELKQTLINLVQSNQFTGRQDPHNHLRFFNKVTSTFRHPEVPNTTIKLLLFPFSLEEEARIWLDKEPSRSILTWEDLVSKFINQFFPPSNTTYLRNKITNFLQKPNETFNEAWEQFKDLLRQCPHHGFSDRRKFLDKIPRECLSIIESKSKVRYSRSRTTDVRANTNAPPPSSSPSNSFDLQQISSSLEDKLDIRMNRFEKSLNDMKNSFVTPSAPLKAVEEKPTGNMFKTVGHIWKPTGRTFTLVGNVCPLTRIATPTIVPHREPIPRVNSTDKPVVTLVVQIVLWYLDSGCSKHMTGDRSQLVNFVQKFLGMVQFGNDHVAKIMGYRLGHNLFSVGQFCDSDLEVAFRQHTCFIRNLDGVDLLTGSRGNNLYTLSPQDMMASSPICLLSKASKTKSWLWHRRLSHLNFGAINHLARQGLRDPHLQKLLKQQKNPLDTIDPDERFHEVSEDDPSKAKGLVRRIRTDNGTEFVNQTLRDYYEEVDISHETSVARSPQQNGVNERRNRTLIEAAHTIEKLGKLQPKADIGIFIGYAPTKKAFRIYNRRTRRIVETIHVDEQTTMASKQRSSGPALNEMTPKTISSGLIMGYGNYKIGNVTISRVYYMEELGHNLFSVGQFCDSDLEVAFRQHTCFIRNLEGVDLLTGSRGNNLYTLSLQDMMASSQICLLSKASKTKSWLWHRRLSHLNFGAINHLARQGLVRGLLKLNFEKDHLCSACAMGKSTKKSHKPKSEDTKYTRRIQELLMILQQTCPYLTNLGTKLVAVTPKNKTKQIRLTEQITKSGKKTVTTPSSANIYSNTPVLSSTGVTLVSSASGSMSQNNTKKNKIRRTQRKSKKNKIKDHLRTVKSSLNKKSVVDSKATSSVINSMTNVHSELKCASCNGCLFFDNHDACVVAYINSMNASIKSKSVKTTVKRKVWKPTGNVFKTVGHIWKPTGRTFKLVGNVCPLTRIATPTIVPPREPIPIVNSTDKPVVTLVYSRKTKAANNKVVQIVLWYLDSGCSKHITGDRSQLVNFVQKFLGTVKFGNDHVAKIMGYGDYQIGNASIPPKRKLDLTTGIHFLRTMATTIEQQVALYEALVPSTQRLRIGRSNFQLPLYIKSKESTLQVVYDVPRRCPFFKAVLVTADVPEIYMIPGQSFDELPFEEDILECLWFLRHSAHLRTLTDVNINKLFQPWRSFGAVINKCLTGKSSSFNSFRLSQAQILWGLYHSRNIDYAFLIWEDFVYEVEYKNHKKSNEMYYPRFTKVIIHHFMSKDLSIPRRNKVNWHYVRDDIIFSTIKVVSRHQNTQQYDAMLHIELTNEEIRNTKAYKEYYACTTGKAAPKPKASTRRKRSGSDTSITPPTTITTPITTVAITPRLNADAKGKQPAKAKSSSDPSELARTDAQQLKILLRRRRQETHISQLGGSGTYEGTGSKPEVLNVPSDDSEEEISWNSSDNEDADAQEKDRDDDEGDEKDESDDGEEDDDDDKDGDERDDDDEEEIAKIDEQDDTERGGDDDEESEIDEESDDEETREDESFDPIPRTPEDSKDDGNGEEDQGLRISEEERLNEVEEANELYRDVDINQGRGLQLSQDIEDSHVTLTPVDPDGQQESSSVSSQFVTSMLNPTSDAGMKSIFATASSPMAPLQTSTPIMTPSTIATIITISHAPIPPTKIPSEALVEAYEADKIILDTYGETVTLKRRRDDESDKDEGPFAGSDRGSKRRREGKELESAYASLQTKTRSIGRSTTGSKSRQVSASESAFVEEPVQTTCQMDEPSYPVFETVADDQPIVQSSRHSDWFSQPKKPPTPDHDWNKTLPAVQGSTQTWISELAKQVDSRSSFNKLLDTPLDFFNFIMNRLRVDTLTPELLAGPTFDLMKGSCTSLIELEYHLEEVYKATTYQLDWVNPEGQQYPHNLLQPLSLIPDNRGRRVIPFAHFINNDLKYLRGGASSRKYTTYVTKMKESEYGNIKWIEDLVPRSMWIQEPINYDKHALWGVSHWGRKRQQFYGFAVNRESTLDVYSKRRIIAVMDLKIVEWHSYKHLDWITVRRDDDKLYKFKEGDFKRLRFQDIEDMLLLFVQGKLSNLTVEERFAFNVSLRMFTRSIIIQRRDKDRAAAMIQAIDKMLKTRRIMRSLERMQYFPQAIWRKGDKDRAAAMIQAIDKMLKTRRIMRSLERFVGGRLYEGDFWMLQRTI